MTLTLTQTIALDQAGGGLLRLARRNLELDVTPEEACGMLASAGQAAGPDPLEDLARLVTETIRKLLLLGAIEDRGGGRVMNLAPVRQFFMGVLGWTPRVAMHEATLDDLCDALSGYAAAHGLRMALETPSPAFLQEMTTLFPDKESDKHGQK